MHPRPAPPSQPVGNAGLTKQRDWHSASVTVDEPATHVGPLGAHMTAHDIVQKSDVQLSCCVHADAATASETARK